ncbi:MAG: hypothetical protein M9949_04040 [Candidatus Kapabacteria bacterium]|nr:hypothetical protein [Candidatus Kapabacteria bacterium]
MKLIKEKMFFIKIFCVFIFYFLLNTTQAIAQKDLESRNSVLKSLKDSIDYYYHTFDTAAFTRILKKCESEIVHHPKGYYANYYAGMLKLILGKINYNIDSDYAYELFTEGVENFHVAEKSNRTGEICALLSATYGKRSSLSGLNAIFLGMKAKSWMYDAAEIEKQSTKINLVAATHLMHLPAFYGGDKKKARRLLSDAFEIQKKNQPSDSLALNWADDAELHAYMAQLEILEKNYEEAKFHMAEALKIKPNYGFVLYDLSNQLKKIKP